MQKTKLKVVTYGQIKTLELKSLIQYYSKLSKKYFYLELIFLKDPNRKIMQNEIPDYKNEKLIILDSKGKHQTTDEFASFISNSDCDLCFLIGNAWGFESLKTNQEKLSISKMTFTHEFTTVLLLEQIFRAGNILSGGKYHK